MPMTLYTEDEINAKDDEIERLRKLVRTAAENLAWAANTLGDDPEKAAIMRNASDCLIKELAGF